MRVDRRACWIALAVAVPAAANPLVKVERKLHAFAAQDDPIADQYVARRHVDGDRRTAT